MARLLVTLKLTAVLDLGDTVSVDQVKEFILAEASEELESHGVAQEFFDVLEDQVIAACPEGVELVMQSSDLSVTTP